MLELSVGWNRELDLREKIINPVLRRATRLVELMRMPSRKALDVVTSGNNDMLTTDGLGEAGELSVVGSERWGVSDDEFAREHSECGGTRLTIRGLRMCTACDGDGIFTKL